MNVRPEDSSVLKLSAHINESTPPPSVARLMARNPASRDVDAVSPDDFEIQESNLGAGVWGPPVGAPVFTIRRAAAEDAEH